jgi:hypothetical protein
MSPRGTFSHSRAQALPAAIPTAVPGQGPSRAPRSRRRMAGRIATWVAGIAAWSALEFTPWLGWGMSTLLPSTKAQIVAATVTPAAMIVAVLVGEQWHGRGRRYPPELVALIWGLGISMLLIAPPVGRGGGHSVAGDIAPALVFTTYGSYVVLFGLLWFLARRDDTGWAAGKRVPRSLARRGLGTTPEPLATARRIPRWRFAALAAVLPFTVVTVAVGVGVTHGDPLNPDVEIAIVPVPALAGTSLEPRVSTAELRELAALEPSLVAGELTDGQPMTRGWLVRGRTEPRPGSPGVFSISLTVSELGPDADLTAARARMAAAADGERLAEGWLPAFKQPDAAAALDGSTLFVLRMGDDSGTEATRTAQLQTLTAELTADRRAAIVEATDPERR